MTLSGNTGEVGLLPKLLDPQVEVFVAVNVLGLEQVIILDTSFDLTHRSPSRRWKGRCGNVAFKSFVMEMMEGCVELGAWARFQIGHSSHCEGLFQSSQFFGQTDVGGPATWSSSIFVRPRHGFDVTEILTARISAARFEILKINPVSPLQTRTISMHNFIRYDDLTHCKLSIAICNLQIGVASIHG